MDKLLNKINKYKTLRLKKANSDNVKYKIAVKNHNDDDENLYSNTLQVYSEIDKYMYPIETDFESLTPKQMLRAMDRCIYMANIVYKTRENNENDENNKRMDKALNAIQKEYKKKILEFKKDFLKLNN